MKIAISTVAPEPDAVLDTRFGRAAAFVLVDTETGEREAFDNPATNAPGGAGIQAAEFVAGKGAEAVISGAFGPKAYSVLEAANVIMYRADSGAVGDVVQSFEDGQLEQVTAPKRGAGRR